VILRRTVMPTRSYQSQVELPVTFGLGAADKVKDVTIRWPSGLVQKVQIERVDQMIDVTEEATAK